MRWDGMAGGCAGCCPVWKSPSLNVPFTKPPSHHTPILPRRSSNKQRTSERARARMDVNMTADQLVEMSLEDIIKAQV